MSTDTPDLPAVKPTATGALMQAQQGALAPISFVPRTIDEAAWLAKVLSTSGLVPSSLRGKPNDILIVILHGLEIGISPMQAVSGGVHVIEGRPSASAEMALALVRRSGLLALWRYVESTEARCVVEVARVGETEPQRFSWTIEQAQRANLAKKDNWAKYPASMLRARATMDACRALFGDVTRGLVLPEEAIEQAQLSVVRYAPAEAAAPAGNGHQAEGPSETMRALEASVQGGEYEADPIAQVLGAVPAEVDMAEIGGRR